MNGVKTCAIPIDSHQENDYGRKEEDGIRETIVVKQWIPDKAKKRDERIKSGDLGGRRILTNNKNDRRIEQMRHDKEDKKTVYKRNTK